MTSPIVPYKFADFIGDLELITSVGSTDEDKIRRIQKKLRLLISGGNFLPQDAKTPALQRYARHLVHEDPKKRFIVVSLVWAPASGGPTSYVIEAGSSRGQSNLVNSDLGSATPSLVAPNVGRGTYYVRVRGKNACGVGPASNEIIVVVP